MVGCTATSTTRFRESSFATFRRGCRLPYPKHGEDRGPTPRAGTPANPSDGRPARGSTGLLGASYPSLIAGLSGAETATS